MKRGRCEKCHCPVRGKKDIWAAFLYIHDGCQMCWLDKWSTQDVIDEEPYERADILGRRMRAFVSCKQPDIEREQAFAEWSTRRDEANAPCENVESWFRPGNARDVGGFRGLLNLTYMREAALAVWPPLPAEMADELKEGD